MNVALLTHNEMLLKNVTAGDANAQHELGQLALKARKPGIALGLFQLSAKQGHRAAQIQLAEIKKLLG